VIQMLPLILLELKIMSCADPVGLFCKFAVPVTLSHAIFLAMRLLHWWHYDVHVQIFSVVGLSAALYTMVKGYHWSPLHIFHHKAVWGLVACSLFSAWFCRSMTLLGFGSDHEEGAQDLGLLAAFYDIFRVVVEPFDLTPANFVHFLSVVLETGNGYVEVLSFVPAVWMVVYEDKTARRFEIAELDTKRTGTAFFLFLIGYYFLEDVYNAKEVWTITPVASIAYIIHYLLVLDFACYILAHIYNPEKLMGDLRKWLPFDIAYDV